MERADLPDPETIPSKVSIPFHVLAIQCLSLCGFEGATILNHFR